MLLVGKLRAMVVVRSIEGYAVVALVELLVAECRGHYNVSRAAHDLKVYSPRPRRHLRLILEFLHVPTVPSKPFLQISVLSCAI
jgi:hypothetical protein